MAEAVGVPVRYPFITISVQLPSSRAVAATALPPLPPRCLVTPLPGDPPV